MRKLTYISLFSSSGVGCYGFQENGFECIATSELLEKRLNIQRFNQKCKYDTGYILGDISLPENQKKILNEVELWKKIEHIKDVDVLVATPPCQGMSVANHKKNNEISRNSLILESIKLVKEIYPKYFVFENVRAFLNTMCVDQKGVHALIKEKIQESLGPIYNIEARVINFKDYGANSSRTRTLVVGTRKDLLFITPYDLFPTQHKAKTLRQVIGKYPALSEMGEISSNDIYHFYRIYDKKMLPWVSHTQEGHSAFENEEPAYRPHCIKNGKIVPNINKNGDKYRRCEWDKVMPCIHTRNDILASQSTIHPTDNRVFSIRELMDLMNIPETFQWSSIPFAELNKMSLTDKRTFLKKEEINIRQSIGEAVPTCIFAQIAQHIVSSEKKVESIRGLSQIIRDYTLTNFSKLYDFIRGNPLNLDTDILSLIIEFANVNKTQTAAFYTPKSLIFDIVKHLPDFPGDSIHILEPSVGAGNFIPYLCERYRNKVIYLDVIDIDKNSLDLLKLLIGKQGYKNLKIHYLQEDFLQYTSTTKYDLIIGNPPFGKVSDKSLLKLYKTQALNQKTNNIFAFFIEHSYHLGKLVSLIVPKSFLSAPEFAATRNLIEQECDLQQIIDFGEKGFPGVKIETIMLLFAATKQHTKNIIVDSYITKESCTQPKEMVFDRDLGYWLLYTNAWFQQVKKTLKLDVFIPFRDRSITKKYTLMKGKIRVLKSRNIGSNTVVNIPGYDSYLDDITPFPVKKFLNTSAVLIPNLSYAPRACFLPPNTIADGSVAILQSKKTFVTKKDLLYFASEEFRQFYRIGRNLGSRSLNIDTNSVKLWGVKRREKNAKSTAE